MKQDWTKSTKIEEASAIIAALNGAFLDYLDLLPILQRKMFSEDILKIIELFQSGDSDFAADKIFKVIAEYPEINREFFPLTRQQIKTRFTKEDVNDEENVQKKIREIENEVPVLGEQIRKILDDYRLNTTALR